MDFASAAIAGGLAVFLWTSVASQVVRICMPATSGERRGPLQSCLNSLWRVMLHDKAGVIPVWTFFASMPRFNIRLLVRDRLCTADFGPWRSVGYTGDRRLRFLWNPDSRRHKCVLDFAAALFRFLQDEPMAELEQVSGQPAYQRLATYCAGLPATPLVTGRQFLLARSFEATPERPPEVLFISAVIRMPTS